ncbi:MAG: flagellar hook protein FlgE [Pseudomonadota bacterium]
MSFFTALSGLNAAQQDISVTSNNIANVGTFGFRGSRAEFADIFFNNPESEPNQQIGAGVDVSRMRRDFSSGTTRATGNIFDLALRGPGFFTVQTGEGAGADFGYTRAGAFNMDANGAVVNAAGHFLHVFPTAESGEPLSTTATQPLQLPLVFGSPEATGNVDLSVQVSLTDNGGYGTQAALPAAPFDPADPSTFAYSTDIPVLDEAGSPISAQAYFVLETAPTPASSEIAYSVQIVRDGIVSVPADPTAQLSFDAAGIQTGALTPLTFTDPAGGTLNINLADSNVAREPFAVADVTADGARELSLSSVDISDDGTVFANFGAERSLAVGRIAIATFPNTQALGSIGNSTYLGTVDSGTVRLGSPGETGFGSVQSGAIEQSNVDLTEELVHLIMAQRNYQASAKALETNGTLAETVLNIRT